MLANSSLPSEGNYRNVSFVGLKKDFNLSAILDIRRMSR